MANSTFKDKTITVLAAATTPTIAQSVKEQYEDVFKRKGIDVDVELLPCQYNETDIASSNWGAVTSSCTEMRVIARAIWRLGANVTTARLAAALADEKATERPDTNQWERDNFFYGGKNVIPKKVVIIKFSFPCPLPARTRPVGASSRRTARPATGW